MRTKVISREDVNDISTSEVLEHCRVDDDYDNELIQSYLLASMNIAEVETNRMLTPSVVDAYTQYHDKKIYLPYGEVSGVTEIKATFDEVEVTIPDTDYIFNEIDESVEIDKKLYINHTDFKIRYNCGYPADALPNAIKQAILMTVATLYNVREDISYGVQAYKTPMTSKRLFDLHRIRTGG